MDAISDEKLVYLKQESDLIRKRIIKTAYNGKGGHITSSLSIVEILIALYLGGILRYDPKKPRWERRDRLVMSKGHGALALYVVMARAGFFPYVDLEKYCGVGSKYGDLATTNVEGVENSGGSLGHGLPFALGCAIGSRMMNDNSLTYVITGDGECQEGTIWEAAMSIGNAGLNNLIWIIDRNGLQAFNKVDEVMSLEPLARKLEDFGFEVFSIDGHDYKELFRSLVVDRDNLPIKPRAIIANTIKGKGVPMLEGAEGWHGRSPKGNEWDCILKQLGLSWEEFERI